MQVRSAHNGNSWLRSQRPVPLSTMLVLLHPRLLVVLLLSTASLSEADSLSSLYVHPAVTRRADSTRSLTSGIRDYRSSYVAWRILAQSSDVRHHRRRKTYIPALKRCPIFLRPSFRPWDSAHIQPTRRISVNHCVHYGTFVIVILPSCGTFICWTNSWSLQNLVNETAYEGTSGNGNQRWHCGRK